MKKIIIILGIVLLFGVFTAPLSARGWRGMGFGPFMGHGPGPDIDPRIGGFPIRPGFDPLTEEQRTQLDELNKKYLEEIAEFRESLSSKLDELYTTLSSKKPDEKKAKALQKEISDLRTKLADKQLDFRLEMVKIIPVSSPARGFTRFMGIDPRMDGLPRRPWRPLTEEQRDQLNGLHKEFQEETAELRDNLSNKSGELRKILTSGKPDEKKAKSLQKEISKLQAELSQKTMGFRLKVREILPETGYAREYGRGFGPFRGYGSHMGRGRGMGRAPGYY
jgi:Spy/CpxP family protein refolding chaperone